MNKAEQARLARIRRMNGKRTKRKPISFEHLLAKHSLPGTIEDNEAGRKSDKKQKELFAAEEAA